MNGPSRRDEFRMIQEQEAMFEQNAGERAQCIRTLDEIQGG